MKRTFTQDEARKIAEKIGMDLSKFSLSEFQTGLSVELEHGKHDPETNVTDDDLNMTGKIAWAHLKEMPDYYSRLNKMESEAENKAEKKLYLSENKKISGVCGGLAEYFGLDSSLVRIGWIIMTVLTGIVPGVVAYIVAAVVIPREPYEGRQDI